MSMVPHILLNFDEIFQWRMLRWFTLGLETIHINGCHPSKDGTDFRHFIPIFIHCQVGYQFLEGSYQQIRWRLKENRMRNQNTSFYYFYRYIDIYVFIAVTSIHLLVDYYSRRLSITQLSVPNLLYIFLSQFTVPNHVIIIKPSSTPKALQIFRLVAHDEGYLRNASCALNQMLRFYFEYFSI